MLTHYALARHKKRRPKRLYDKLPRLMKMITKEYWKHNKKL
jgi:hypothetical protein